MATEKKRVTLHPLKSDGTLNTKVNLYPKTFLDGIVDRNGNPVDIQTLLVAGENITIENGVISATGNVTQEQLEQAISSATENLINEEQLESAITEAVSDKVTEEDLEDALTNKQDILTAGEGINLEDNNISVKEADFDDEAHLYNSYKNVIFPIDAIVLPSSEIFPDGKTYTLDELERAWLEYGDGAPYSGDSFLNNLSTSVIIVPGVWSPTDKFSYELRVYSSATKKEVPIIPGPIPYLADTDFAFTAYFIRLDDNYTPARYVQEGIFKDGLPVGVTLVIAVSNDLAL